MKIRCYLPLLAMSILSACHRHQAWTNDKLTPFDYVVNAPSNSPLSKDTALIVQKVERQIRAELDSKDPAWWAGEYGRGDGYVNDSLMLSPRSGFSFATHGCEGLYDRTFGSVVETNGLVALHRQVEPVEKGFRAGPYLPVRWGNRTFLISTNELGNFCKDVARGRCGSGGSASSYLVKINGDAVQLYDLPQMDKSCTATILSLVIAASVVRVENVLTNSESGALSAYCRMDKGTDDGLGHGAVFFHGVQEHTVYGAFPDFRRNDRSNGVLQVWIPKGKSFPRPGMKFSTVLWKGPNGPTVENPAERKK